MFNSKKQTLFIGENKQKTSANQFLNAGKKTSAITASGNGAMKYNTSGNDFVDQFSALGDYKKPRPYYEVETDMSVLWAQNAYLTVCLIFFIRLITRIVSLFDGTKTTSVQKGAGLKHEGILRMIWLSVNHPDTFWKNISLFISVGSWKDIIQMLSYDLQYNGWNDRILDWNKFGQLILVGLENPHTSELVKKYLPQIKANAKCTTIESQADNIIAKWICSLLFGTKNSSSTYKRYRKLKSSGTAHQWQQLISQQKHNLIDFNTIHGRALSLLVSGHYLANHRLEAKYNEWISNKPIAKFTGYVHELATKISYNLKPYQKKTINAQYNQLLKLAGETHSNLIVVKDTSGSMDSNVIGMKFSSYHVAKSLSIFLANLLKGYFHNHYIDFSKEAKLRQLKGENFVEYWQTEFRLESANTNFMSVCDLFINIHKQGVEETEFPSGIICISDGQFDAENWDYGPISGQFKAKLLANGFSLHFIENFKFIFWDIRNTFYDNKYKNAKFESYGPEKNVFYFGGFDPSVITFLTGQNIDSKTPTTAEELFQAAMNQEIMNMIEI